MIDEEVVLPTGPEDDALVAEMLGAAKMWPGQEEVSAMRQVAARYRLENASLRRPTPPPDVALAKAIESLKLQAASSPVTFMLTNECGNAVLAALASQDAPSVDALPCIDEAGEITPEQWEALHPRTTTTAVDAAFIEAIHERTPNGEWLAVKHHPNGDWSVAHAPLPTTAASPGESEVERREALMEFAWSYEHEGETCFAVDIDDAIASLPYRESIVAETVAAIGAWLRNVWALDRRNRLHKGATQEAADAIERGDWRSSQGGSDNGRR